jgi:hypothetical protein
MAHNEHLSMTATLQVGDRVIGNHSCLPPFRTDITPTNSDTYVSKLVRRGRHNLASRHYIVPSFYCSYEASNQSPILYLLLHSTMHGSLPNPRISFPAPSRFVQTTTGPNTLNYRSSSNTTHHATARMGHISKQCQTCYRRHAGC